MARGVGVRGRRRRRWCRRDARRRAAPQVGVGDEDRERADGARRLRGRGHRARRRARPARGDAAAPALARLGDLPGLRRRRRSPRGPSYLLQPGHRARRRASRAGDRPVVRAGAQRPRTRAARHGGHPAPGFPGARDGRPDRRPRGAGPGVARAATPAAAGRRVGLDARLPRSRRGPAGVRPSDPERLGPRVRDPRPQVPALDRARKLPGDLRALRSVRSFLWVDPSAGLACVSLSDRAFGEWAIEAWPPLSSKVLAAYGH